MYCGLYETFTVFNRLPLCENRNVPYRETVRGRKKLKPFAKGVPVALIMSLFFVLIIFKLVINYHRSGF